MPIVGELLPGGERAAGARRKLLGYALDSTHEDGGPKARGFGRILGITIEDIDYLEGAIQTGILVVPISSAGHNPPWGVNCVVMVPVRGLGGKSGRVVNVRTAWALESPSASPRLASAFPKP